MKNEKQILAFFTLTCVLVSGFLFSCTTRSTLPLPFPPPDSIPIPFLPGIVSTDSLDFNAAFSTDGKSFYFSRSEARRLKISVSHHDGKNWTLPIPASFTDTKYSQADPAFGPDGKLYFISNRPTSPSDSLLDYDIWRITPLADERWSEPENVKTINSDSSEFYISFSRNGNLYFSSSRKGGFGEEDIYVSRLVDKEYTTPVNIGATINSQKSEYDPCIFPNEDFIIFTSSNREDTFGAGDLYCAKRGNDGWIKPVNLGRPFNTETREYCAYFSPDSRYFFFTSQRDVKWVDAKILKTQIDKLYRSTE